MSIRVRSLTALVVLAAAPAVAQEDALWSESPTPPAVRFHPGAEELAALVLADRYAFEPERLVADREWVEDRTEDLLERWEEEGPLLLRRITDYAGFEWPYRDIEVHLVRYWPVISIEYPLVLAVGAIRAGGRDVEIPDDEDFLTLVLAHQLTHYLLDPPRFLSDRPHLAARDHPFLSPGAFDAEAMVNWVVYRALEDLWGRERLEEATGRDLWRSYNPSQGYVEDLLGRWSLSRTRPLRTWLDEHARGSEPFDLRDRYLRETETRVPSPGAVPRERRTGTDYGIDLGQTYGGDVFVAFVDEGSPAHRAGALQGDVLLTIDGRPAGRVDEAQARMTDAWKDRGEVHVSVRRGGQEVFLTIERF